MKVYTVEEIIDLGTHVVSVHYNETSAEAERAKRNAEHYKLYSRSGITNWFEVCEYEVVE